MALLYKGWVTQSVSAGPLVQCRHWRAVQPLIICFWLASSKLLFKWAKWERIEWWVRTEKLNHVSYVGPESALNLLIATPYRTLAIAQPSPDRHLITGSAFRHFGQELSDFMRRKNWSKRSQSIDMQITQQRVLSDFYLKNDAIIRFRNNWFGNYSKTFHRLYIGKGNPVLFTERSEWSLSEIETDIVKEVSIGFSASLSESMAIPFWRWFEV